MNTQINPNAEKVRMEYFGNRTGAVTYHGKRRQYRFGNNTIDRFQDVDPEDVERLLSLPGFRLIGRDALEYQSSGGEFVPEPSGEIAPEIVPESVPELETIDMPEPSGEGILVESGVPPALDVDPLPNTVKEIKSAVRGADLDTLLSWLREEHDNKNRKTAIEAIDSALEEM